MCQWRGGSARALAVGFWRDGGPSERGMLSRRRLTSLLLCHAAASAQERSSSSDFAHDTGWRIQDLALRPDAHAKLVRNDRASNQVPAVFANGGTAVAEAFGQLPEHAGTSIERTTREHVRERFASGPHDQPDPSGCGSPDAAARPLGHSTRYRGRNAA